MSYADLWLFFTLVAVIVLILIAGKDPMFWGDDDDHK